MKYNDRKLDDKDIKKAALFYLDGNSLRSVAKVFHVSHVTLRTYFLEVLSQIDQLLANEVHAALQDNVPMSIKLPEVEDRVYKTYYMFVENRLSITEISHYFGVSFFTTYRDLERRLYLLHEVKPEFVTIEMVNRVRELMKSHRLDNLTPGSDAYLNEKRSNGRFTK